MTITTTLATNALTTVEKVKQQGAGIRQNDPTQDDAIRYLINEASTAMMLYGRTEFKSTKASTTNSDGAMTSGSAILTSASAPFSAADVGYAIIVHGAGTGGDALQTTILSYQSTTQVTLALAAGTTVTAATYFFSNASRTFQLRRDNESIAGRIDFGMFDAQTISTVYAETQPTGGSILLDPTVLQYQATPVEHWNGVYKGLTIYSPTAAFGAPYVAGIQHTALVTGVWGWKAVPSDVEGACVEQVKQWLLTGYQVSSGIGIPNESADSSMSGPRHQLAYSTLQTLDRYKSLLFA